MAVHPRRRGEHADFWAGRPEWCGSSPQARGTLPLAQYPRGRHRFIPAGAGNTGRSGSAIMADTVHPRRRGEHTEQVALFSWARGSSPQARGTLLSLLSHRCQLRFIPAGAGNTSVCRKCLVSCSVHPRRRGEHKQAKFSGAPIDGSSPQARGTLRRMKNTNPDHRFIPAGAGNTG